MTITYKKTIEGTIWLLTVALLSSTYILYSYSWGRYVFLGLAVAIMFISIVSSQEGIALSVEPFFTRTLIFTVYVLLTALWSWSMSRTISSAKTLLQICLCYLPILMHFKKHGTIEPLLKAVMWTGYIVALYSIGFYGLDSLFNATSSHAFRLSNEYNNVNSIGMIAAYACVVQAYLLLYRGLSVSALFVLPAILVIAATQSRKAVAILIIGIALVVLIKNIRNKRFLRVVFISAVIIAAFAVLVYFLSKISLFRGVYERIESMIAGFTGVGKADGSTIVREKMRRAGMAQFYKTPLLGIGIGASARITAQDIGISTYLHCNYVELLSCGGIIGFILYYSIYVYLFKNTVFRYRFIDDETVICFVLMTLNLIMDYGAVSYYSKLQYFLFVIYFLHANDLRQKYKGAKQRPKNEKVLQSA